MSMDPMDLAKEQIISTFQYEDETRRLEELRQAEEGEGGIATIRPEE